MFKPKHTLGLAAVLALVAAQLGQAASYTFDRGAGNMNWDAGANWNPDAPLPFTAADTAVLNMNNATLTASTAGYTAAVGTLQFLGNAWTIGGAGTSLTGLSVNSISGAANAAQTFPAALTVSDLSATGLTINRTANTDTYNALLNLTGNLVFNAAGHTAILVNTGNVIGGGNVNLQNGTLQARNLGSLGTPAANLNISGGALQLRSDASTTWGNAVTTTAATTINIDRIATGTGQVHTLGPLTINTTGILTLAAQTAANYNSLVFGQVNLGANATISNQITAANTSTTLGPLNGGANTLTFNNTGEVVFSGPAVSQTGDISLAPATAGGKLTLTAARVSGGTIKATNGGEISYLADDAGDGAQIQAVGTTNPCQITLGAVSSVGTGTFRVDSGNVLVAGTASLAQKINAAAGGNLTIAANAIVAEPFSGQIDQYFTGLPKSTLHYGIATDANWSLSFGGPGDFKGLSNDRTARMFSGTITANAAAPGIAAFSLQGVGTTGLTLGSGFAPATIGMGAGVTAATVNILGTVSLGSDLNNFVGTTFAVPNLATLKLTTPASLGGAGLNIVGGKVSLANSATTYTLDALTFDARSGGSPTLELTSATSWLNLNSDITFLTGPAANNVARITGSGTLNLGAGRTFNIADGAYTPDFSLETKVSGGPLVKEGAGLLSLTKANNDFSGLTINGGTVKLTAIAAAGAGLVTVRNGAALEASGYYTLGAGSVSVESGARVLVSNANGLDRQSSPDPTVTFQSGSVLEVAVPGIYGAPLVLDNGAIIRLSDAGALGGAGSPQLTAAMISPDASHKHVVQLNASGSFTNLANVGANTVLEIYGADRTITGSALNLAKTFYLTNDASSRTILNNATNNLTISAATTLAATSGTTLTVQEAIVGGAFDLTVGYAGALDGLDKTNGTVNLNGATAIGGSVLVQSGVLAIGDGAEGAMLAGTLAADVRVPDGRRAQLLFPVGATRKDVGQKISILGGTTGDRSLTVSRSTGASPVAVNLNNLYLAAGAVLSIEEDNSDVRFGAKLAGAATLVKNAANSSDVDIASLASDTAGTARQFQIGRTTDSLSTNVYGSVSSDVTVTINNAAVSFQPGASLAGTVNFNNAASGTLTINAGQDGAAGLAAGTINLGSAGRTLTGYVNETAAAPALTNAVGTLINVAAADADLNTVDAVLKAGRNLTATLPGTVHFSNVALPANATLEGQSDNNAVLKASLTLAGDVAYKNDSGASVTLGNVSGGTTRTLYLIGAGATPINGTITAKRLVVGTASVAGAGTVTNSSALALADKVLETANGTLTVNGVAGVPADHAFYVNGPSAVVNFAVTALGTVDPADSSKPLVASITGSAAGGKVTLPDTGAGGEKVKLTGAINLSQTTLAQPDTDQGGVNMTRTFYYNPTSYTDTANSKLALGSIAAGTSTTPSGTELQNYGGYFIASATVNAKVLHSAQTGTARPILLGARGSSTTLTFKGMMDLYTLQGNNGLDTSNKSALGLGTQSSGTVVIDPAAAIRSTVVTAGALSDSQPVYFGGDGTGTVKFMPGFVNNHVTNTGGAGSYAIDPASYASRQWIIGRAHVETGATQNLPYGTETVNAATGLPATFGGSITFAIANGGVWKVGTANQVYGGQVQASVGGTIDVSDSVGDGTGTALRLDQNGKVVLDAARTLTKSGKGTLQINGSTSFGDGANLRVSAGTLNFAQPAGSTVTVGATTALTLTIESGSPGGTVNVDATGRDPFTDSAIAIRHINVLNNSATGLNVNAGAATIAGLGGTGTTSVASGAALTVTGSISQPLLSLAGLLNLGGGLDMSGASGGTLNWELKTLKDLTNGAAGTDFGGVSLTGGDLKLGGDAGNALLTLDFSLLSSGAGPNGGDPFWSNPHAWKVIDVTSPGTNNTGLSFKSITNGLGWTAGYFTTSVGTGADAGDILLKYNTGSAVTFSGSAKWSGPNQGGWATDANWTDTASGHEGIHKAPGWAPPASQVAVLQGTPGAAAMSVNLGTATPTLNTMTFQPDTGNNDTLFVIGGATGDGKITLQDAALARIDVSGSKTQEIGVPLTLASPTKITTNGAGSQLKISGDIRDGGPNVILTKDGPGTLVLSGTNDYDQMVVSAGTVEIVAAHAVALGGKPLTIASGATVWFDVDIVYGAASRSPATRAVSVSPVPEPCTLALFGVAGVAALAVWLKRRLRR